MKSGKKPSSSNEKVSYKEQILKIMGKELNGICTTSEIAEKVGLSWNTAEKYLLELTIDGNIQRMKKTGVNLWILNEVVLND